MNAQDGEIADFLSNYPAEVRDVTQRLRKIVIATIPNAVEELDRSGKVIGYGFGPGYAGLVCTIIVSKKGVKLGIVRGAHLPDPHKLLEGAGKQHRYVAFERAADFSKVGLKTLIESAVAVWRNKAASVD